MDTNELRETLKALCPETETDPNRIEVLAKANMQLDQIEKENRELQTHAQDLAAKYRAAIMNQPLPPTGQEEKGPGDETKKRSFEEILAEKRAAKAAKK